MKSELATKRLDTSLPSRLLSLDITYKGKGTIHSIVYHFDTWSYEWELSLENRVLSFCVVFRPLVSEVHYVIYGLEENTRAMKRGIFEGSAQFTCMIESCADPKMWWSYETSSPLWQQ